MSHHYSHLHLSCCCSPNLAPPFSPSLAAASASPQPSPQAASSCGSPQDALVARLGPACCARTPSLSSGSRAGRIGNKLSTVDNRQTKGQQDRMIEFCQPENQACPSCLLSFHPITLLSISHISTPSLFLLPQLSHWLLPTPDFQLWT